MSERQPRSNNFSPELRAKLRMPPADLLSVEERRRLHQFATEAQIARNVTENIASTLRLS